MAQSTDTHSFSLNKDLGKALEAMDLSDGQKHFLRSRWLDQVIRMEKKASTYRGWHYSLRLTAIVFGIVVPLLISVNASNLNASKTVQRVVTGFSVLVVGSLILEEFLNYGERWGNARRTVEFLKAQGWQFLQLSGPYFPYTSHTEAFPLFAEQVEDLIQRPLGTSLTPMTLTTDGPTQK